MATFRKLYIIVPAKNILLIYIFQSIPITYICRHNNNIFFYVRIYVNKMTIFITKVLYMA